MKRLSTLQLIPGMVVAEDVMSMNHQLVITKDTVLTDQLITKLDMYGILSIYIKEEHVISIPTEDDIQRSSYSQRVRNSPEFAAFKESYDVEVDSFKNVINNVVEKNATLDVKELLQQSLNIISNANGHIGIMDMLSNMRDYDDSTYAHCLNVGLICNVFAHWLDFSDEDIQMATTCGLLHDIGKLLVPRDLITKPGKLSTEEFNKVKKHPIEGYTLLRSQNIDDHICNSALMHHERCDGTGYPLNFKAHQIDRFAKVVAIVDVYDAMTAARVYRGPLCPFKVIEIFESEGIQKYDVSYILLFLENIVNTYIQNRCRLSDGREGDIIFINKDKLSRPIIQCGTEYINLVEHSSLFIECLL